MECRHSECRKPSRNGNQFLGNVPQNESRNVLTLWVPPVHFRYGIYVGAHVMWGMDLNNLYTERNRKIVSAQGDLNIPTFHLGRQEERPRKMLGTDSRNSFGCAKNESVPLRCSWKGARTQSSVQAQRRAGGGSPQGTFDPPPPWLTTGAGRV